MWSMGDAGGGRRHCVCDKNYGTLTLCNQWVAVKVGELGRRVKGQEMLESRTQARMRQLTGTSVQICVSGVPRRM